MNKKGFTLIELLAVIVILAIIAVIATPMVLNTIDDARKGAAKASAETYMRAIEEYMVKSQLDTSKPQLQAGVRYQLSSTKYEVASLANPDEVFINDLIEVKGDKPESGYVIVSTKGTVETMEMVMNDYPVACANNSCEVAEEGEYEAYKVGDAVTIDGVGYHVTKASNTVNEYVTLLRDESIGDFVFDENGGTDFETSTLKTYLDSTYKTTFGNKEQYIQEITLLDVGNYESNGVTEAGSFDFVYNGILKDSIEGTLIYLYQNYKSVFFVTEEGTQTITYGTVKTESISQFWTKTRGSYGLGNGIIVGLDKYYSDDNSFVGYCLPVRGADGEGASDAICPAGANASNEKLPVRPVVVISKKALD